MTLNEFYKMILDKVSNEVTTTLTMDTLMFIKNNVEMKDFEQTRLTARTVMEDGAIKIYGNYGSYSHQEFLYKVIIPIPDEIKSILTGLTDGVPYSKQYEDFRGLFADITDIVYNQLKDLGLQPLSTSSKFDVDEFPDAVYVLNEFRIRHI